MSTRYALRRKRFKDFVTTLLCKYEDKMRVKIGVTLFMDDPQAKVLCRIT